MKDENKSNQAKQSLMGVLQNYRSKLCKIHLSTWYFSVFFFVTIFLVSMWVWWVGFYNSNPSEQVITKFESSQENFEAMKVNTENAIETLKIRKQKTSSPKDFLTQRDLFVDYRKFEALAPKKEEISPEVLLQIPADRIETNSIQ